MNPLAIKEDGKTLGRFGSLPRLGLRQRLRNLRLGKGAAHRDQTTTDLRASEARFKGVLAASPDAVIIVNDAGLIEFASDRVTDIFGYAPGELADKPIEVLIPERFRGAHLDQLKTYFRKPTTRMMGSGLFLWGRRKDATEFPAEISLSPVAMADRAAAIAAVRDISARRALEALQQKAAEALRESERRLRYFIKYSPAAIAILDKELRYLVYSDRWLADYGLAGRDLRGLSHYEVFPEIPDRWRDIHRRALAGETLRADEDSFTRGDGRVQWLRWEVRPWFDTLGNIGGVAFLTEDITDRKRMEAQLLQAQKMQAIGQLTGGIAHDFNNLLTVILGNAETLLDEMKDDDAHRKLVEPIFAAAERGAGLTHLMLAFARRQALESSTFDLNEVVTRMNALMRRTIGENVEVDLRLTKSLWRVTTDIRQMETAILNVVLNARDAMPQGGKLTIETGNVELSEDYAAHSVEVIPGQYVMMALSDTGSGIAPEILDRIFEPFFTTKPVGKGTGLGLSMVHGFVKQTGGHIQIYSEVGHGTCVKIFLPRAKADATTAVPSAWTPATLATGTESILVVEDDPHVRLFAVQQLRRLGYSVTEASDGRSALQEVARSGAPDLLFTDVVMPGGMTGSQLAERVGQMAPGIKVLYTSGYTENSSLHHGRLDPGVHLLQKPYRSEKLAHKVREVLDL
ncbi:PAS domain-containing sensor histidine kinase [Bradyrhizobium sp. CCBAU 53338]|uniref:hybrid sensor histidine kinase/response regulator n=1 Tax=Bradyrhizobium sp. CCBAU 53338 TaxID=1325111 RepID=UPI00188A92DE|nr:PAS domain-containing sensor histidine kinase [Bradyrhizobium sp. CCBAU 53338]QOZ53277.1 hybrid sensor histidine kinase/response regulator [Bradyrhizobium sp. CCBAU 53338]